ncbi:MAG: hypothetical protein ACFCVE_05045 [Phycisphaerae bacterium]
MPEPTQRKLSDISHLFLSNVRTLHTSGQTPSRLPPGAPRPEAQPATHRSTDDQADRHAESRADGLANPSRPVQGQPETRLPATGSGALGWPTAGPAADRRPVTLVVTQHLEGKSNLAVACVAAAACGTGRRIALLKLDRAGVSLSLFDNAETTADETPETPDAAEGRHVIAALTELDLEVDEWILCLDAYHTPEARRLVDTVGRALLVATCDHDGIVAAYRTLKGMPAEVRPYMTLGLLGASDAYEQHVVFNKLAGVCQKFLDWPVSPEPVLLGDAEALEHVILPRYAGPWDAARAAAEWAAVAAFLETPRQDEADTTGQLFDEPARPADPSPAPSPAPSPDAATLEEAELEVAAVAVPARPATSSHPAHLRLTETDVPTTGQSVPLDADDADGTNNAEPEDEIIALTGGVSTLAAEVVRRRGWQPTTVRCPVCDVASLAVDAVGRLHVVASLPKGLSKVAQALAALRWANQNLDLLAMALPQTKLRPTLPARLLLLVDHADAGSAALVPLASPDADTSAVSVQSYRRLRWSGQVGVLLEAA